MVRKNVKYIRWDILALIVIFSVIVYSQIPYAIHDTRPCMDLDLEYSEYSATFHYYLSSFFGSEVSMVKQNEYQSFHGKITLLEKSLGGCFLVFGKSLVVYRLVFLVLFLFFLSSVYVLGGRLLGAFGGIWISLFLLSIPGFVTYARKCWPHLYVAGFLFYAIYFFLMSKSFSHKKYCILFTLAIASAIMIHYSACLYVGLFLLWIIGVTFKRSKSILIVFCVFLGCFLYVEMAYTLNSPFYLRLILFVAAGGLFVYSKRTLTNFINSLVCSTLLIPPAFLAHCAGQFMVSMHNHTEEVWSRTRYISHYLSSITYAIPYKSVYFGFLCLLFLYTLFVLLKRRSHGEPIFLEKGIALLFVLLMLPSLTPFMLKRGGLPIHVQSFVMAIFFLVSVVSRVQRIYVRIIILTIVLFHALFIQLKPSYLYANKIPLYYESLVINRANWGIRDVCKFVKEIAQDKETHINIATLDPYAFYDMKIYPLDKLSLELAAHQQNVSYLKIEDIDHFYKLSTEYPIDYFLLERHHKRNRKILDEMEEILNSSPDFELVCRFEATEKQLLIYKYIGAGKKISGS